MLDPDRLADLTQQELYLADEILIAAYGNMVHRTNGNDFQGGVEWDSAVQMLYDKIVGRSD